ncbi:Jjj3p NDAI_0D00500 [Naumovozyma dairenensis CBS 421]|uniref:Diphthamide biosynthesis protein 4 n=1 Tax=Naumovozyma dairenensis (strain ATCC 10597 / BCRC 20456 / CBS 421 / NBRC 0211 / NRRL Y-12639) TaxID=1071378 RepID=G0W9A3_NAUDC|nr:hypothetical protein NDAI_0D00500 [Naumovozyma dairenensis CBS 421]CCD24364.1 hypothetical protein NDAI_0D00500 [Naumovozyma dairenensis CBS 421]
MTKSSSRITHYEVLNINSDATLQEIKKAYKQKLLNIHPDKSSTQILPISITTNDLTSVSINQIQQAYKILSNESTREQYDEELLETFKKLGYHNHGDGLDEFSLDDFTFDETTCNYNMNCPRCKTLNGFQFNEDSLDEFANTNINTNTNTNGGSSAFQVLAQCNSCSLWLKVNFAIASEDENEDENEDEE